MEDCWYFSVYWGMLDWVAPLFEWGEACVAATAFCWYVSHIIFYLGDTAAAAVSFMELFHYFFLSWYW